MGRSDAIVDTNVLVVASGWAQQASTDCVRRSIARLQRIREECFLLLDDHGRILREYRKQFDHVSTQSIGFQFYLWVHNNQANPEYCRKVAVTPHATRGFGEFPGDDDLVMFDYDDRVFVAVALANDRVAVVLNASDSDWWDYREALDRHGVEIDFVCPELMTTS